MNLSHRIQLDPTASQREYFARAAGTSRFVWNLALAEWNEQYRLGGKPKAVDLKRYFNSFKYEAYPWLKGVHRDAHSQPFANLQTAFNNYFAGRAKRPAFKKKGKSRDSFYVANDRFSVAGYRVRLPVVGYVRMTEALRFKGKLLSAVVSREVDRWFVSISVEMPEPAVAAPTGDPIGIDLGLTTFAALSTGERVKAPKPLAASIKRLRRLQRRVSRKVKGSNNRRKANARVAKLHYRIKNVRRDFVHKFTTRIASAHRQVCIEDLNVAGMSKNHALARAISDVLWSETRRQLDYKCRLFGSELVVRDRFFPSSKICSECSLKADAMPLSVREWTCADCGAVHDRDSNAATNILNGPIRAASPEFTPREIAALAVSNDRETAVDERGTITGQPMFAHNLDTRVS